MRKALLILLLPALLFVSCKQSKEDMLARKWQAIKVDNPQQDELMKEQETFIDTFGKGNDDATNKAIYGFSNVDSARESLQAEYKDYKDMQEHSIENTWFDFNKNGVVKMNFSGQLDSAKWQLDKEGKLVLDEQMLKGSGTSIEMEIVELADTILKLKFNDNNGTSTVTFRPDKK